MHAELTHFERLAVYSAHMRSADQWDGHAAYARKRATPDKIGWQHYLKAAIHAERKARQHRERGRAFKPKP